MQLSKQTLSLSSTQAQYLKFDLLNNMTALLPIDQLAAVLKIEAGRITAIPHLPAWVMGVYNWRGEILWVIDIGHILGGVPLYRQNTSSTQYSTLLLEQSLGETSESSYLGLAVHQVRDIELLSLDTIQSPTVVSEALVPFLRGYWLGIAGEMMMLLDSPAIFNYMPT